MDTLEAGESTRRDTDATSTVNANNVKTHGRYNRYARMLR